MRSTFKILFYINRGKEKDGTVPVMGRITINGSIAQFSCKQRINPGFWDVKANRAKGRKRDSLILNRALDNIRVQITKHYQYLSDRQSYVNAEIVRNAWLGIGRGYDTLLLAFDNHNKEYEKRAGKDRSKDTYVKYLLVRKHLARFITTRYRRSDILLKEITEDFIKDFTIYLSVTVGLASSTIWLYCSPLKMIITRAHNNGIIAINPFANYRISAQVKQREYLTEQELKILIKYKLDNPRLEIVRNIFLFSCFTGLSYIDIKNLTPKQISTASDGHAWIISHRIKTNTPFSVKLMDIPRRIINKYMSCSNSEYVFKVPTNCICNNRLKEISRACGIEKHVTFHIARHTFATLALTKGVPIESVSRILGHTKITTTQIYAKITNEKVGKDMDILSKKLESLSFFEI